MTALFLAGFSLWSLAKPDEARSLGERRPLASFPELSLETAASGAFMQEFESYALDQFPLRDDLRTLKAVTTFYVLGQKDNNGVYLQNGYVSRLDYPLNEQSVSHAADRFRWIYDKYLAGKGGRIYLSVIPDKNYFLADRNGYPSMDYEALVRQLRERMEYAKYIDIFPLLELADYYYTDTHWRQERLLGTARGLAGGMGVSLSETYAQRQTNIPFYGVYYGQAALPLPPDTLVYLDSPLLAGCTVYDYETEKEIPVYDMEKAAGSDPYEMFLSGSKSLLAVRNPAAPSDRRLIIFRDSFGSSIAPLLAEGYREITLVDIRYLSPALLGRFLTFEDQDVLFLYSTSVLNNSITIK